ncbi:hypothetical protein KUL42_25700 [Alteromonas sp. KUL42]|uniref:DUF2059 domain-containing protein n=1 Tax=Alteromonas sp. KUL42 TaxID=2480797 RepID=UPI0010361CF5|nr:DUF2059 domain-containing protein [Alteromonas sp. KUL42]TAP34406.1 DUF2059 domain-containing protein [Alteromonas sp. KUL42]GEA07809.1 hypothetical protein KUL42_25700 [Alteromonas sp. KUL42]
MKYIVLLLTLMSSIALANTQIYALLEANGAKAYFAQSQEKMAAITIALDPKLAAHEKTVKEWASTYFAWKQIRESLVPIYESKFTADEIEELIGFYRTGSDPSFYETQTGKKLKSLQPLINQEFIAAGHRYMITVSPHLEEMINTKKDL